jgi:hypothetical protein
MLGQVSTVWLLDGVAWLRHEGVHGRIYAPLLKNEPIEFGPLDWRNEILNYHSHD